MDTDGPPRPDPRATSTLDASVVSAGPASPRGAVPRFADGTTLAKRYAVVRFLGAGGMGEVYEVDDRELAERVALKTLHAPAADARAAAEARLRREVAVARRVTDPRVCRIFDMGIHDGNPDSPPTPFLTMELTSNETLEARVRRAGPAPFDVAWDLMLQMARGLAAVHAAGIVHRDLKSANVLFARDEAMSDWSAGAPKVKISDFGLAVLRASDEESVPTGRSGTPGYMAPEQLFAGVATFASDVYALGIIVREVATGQAPSRIGLLPTGRRTPPVDPRLARVVDRCIALDPADRFPSAAEVVQALEAIPKPTSAPRRWRRPFASVAVACAAVALTAIGFRVAHPRTPQVHASARASIAVLELTTPDDLGELRWVPTAVTEMLRIELGAGDALRVVDGDRTARARTGGVTDDATVARAVDASHVVTGTLRVDDPHRKAVAISLALKDDGGRSIRTLRASTDVAGLRAATAALADDLRDELGIRAPSPVDRSETDVLLPRGAEATEAYAEGVYDLRQGEVAPARDAFRRAVSAEPDLPLPHARLSAVYSQLGLAGPAREEAKLAVQAASRAPRRIQLEVEGAEREAMVDWPAASETYRALRRFFPDTIDYGLAVARVERLARHASSSFEALASLRKMPPPLGTDPRIAYEEAEAASDDGDMIHAQEAATRARRDAVERKDRWLAARAAIVESWALAHLGRGPEADVLLQEARRTFEELGDRSHTGYAVHTMGQVAYHAGALNDALAKEHEALSILHQAGNAEYARIVENSIGVMEMELGHLRDALAMFERGRDDAEKAENRADVASALVNIAQIHVARGDYAAAEEAIRRSLELAEGGGPGDLAPVASALRGSLLLQEGKVGEARREVGALLEAGEKSGSDELTVAGQSGIAEAAFESSADDAFLELVNRLEARLAGSAPSGVVGPGAALVMRVALARGDARKALAVFEQWPQSKTLDATFSAPSVLSLRARALAFTSDTPGAQSALDAAEAYPNESLEARVDVLLARATLAAVRRDTAACASAIRDAEGEARSKHAAQFELRVLDAAAQLEKRYGMPRGAMAAWRAAATNPAFAELGRVRRPPR